MEKCCKICNEVKTIDNFRKTSNGKGIFGVGSRCKKCLSIKDKIYRENNKLIIKTKRDENYSIVENRKKIREYHKSYYNNNKEKLLPKLLERQKKRRDKINANNRLKYKNDPVYKLKHNIRRSILKGLNGNQKKDSTVVILGCSIEDFKNYIESKWESWMNWENYGKFKKNEKNYGWDIDHIIPTSSAKTPEEIIKLNHYTNLQPLCSYVNRYVKKDKSLF